METTGRQKQVLPNLIVVKFDETKNWREDIQEKAGKIFGYYLVDMSEITHCAELTGSYYCHFLYNRVDNLDSFAVNDSEYSDELFEIEDGGLNDQNIYVSEFTKFNIVADSYCKKFKEDEMKEFLEEENYQELLDDAIEYYKCNPVE